MNETAKVLNKDENVIWQGKPQYVPYLVSVIPAVIFGLVWLSASSFFFFSLLGKVPVPFMLFVGFFVAIGVLITLGIPLYAVLVYKYIWYVITDKRVILQGGLIGRDFDFVDYDKVESAGVNVGVIDKVFGRNSGSIRIYANRLVYVSGKNGGGTRNVPFNLAHITDPYAAFELFKKVSFDVKADISFPNVLRPQENVGYKTEYTRGQESGEQKT